MPERSSTAWRWDYSTPPKCPCILTVEDFELLSSGLEGRSLQPCSEGAAEKKIYRVSGWLENELDLVAELFGLASTTEDAPTPAARFVRTALKAFSTCSVNARQWRNEWENDRRSDKNTDSMSVAADVLLDLYALYERLFIETGAVSVEVSGTRRPGWWKSRPAIVADLERWRVRLEREAEGGRDFGAFRELLSSQHRLLRRLERRVAPNDSALFVAASALSFVSAECHVSRSFGGSSLMLLNRAVEYALCALAIENGAARFANSGVILDSGAQCSVYELLNVSDRTNSLAPNSTSRAIFQRVNTTRNQLSFTHGLARVCAKDVAGVIDEVKAAIKGLNPTSGWAAAVRALQVRRSSVEIALARVFGVSENVVTYELM